MAQDIRTYSGLVSSVQSWLDTSEGNLVDAIPNMIALAEADFRRNIVTPDMETTVTFDPTSTTLPTDVDSIRLFAVLDTNYTPQAPIDAVTPDTFYTLPTSPTGYPRYYTVSNESLMVWPAPDQAYSAVLNYRQSIPSVTSGNPTNWLLIAHPDVYLFGTLLQAEFFGWTDDRLPLIQAKLSSLIDDVNTAGNRKRYGGPLVMQVQNTDNVFRYT